MGINVDLKQAVYALSDALDLIGMDDVAHGKRVGIMAAECAKALGLSPADSTFMFDLGLLHDIGVSSTLMHKHLVEEFDWSGSQQHSEVGAKLLAGFKPLAAMSAPIRLHHTRWDQLLETDTDPQVARQANLIYLVDRVDATAAPYYASNMVLLHKREIQQAIAQHAGTYFAPELVEIFLAASNREAFWLSLEPRAIQSYLQDQLASSKPHQMSIAEVKQLAEIFSRIVDAKSPFTAEHSLGVAQISHLLAEKMGLPSERCDMLEIAGLLHDLGKLRVPDEILEKPSQLDFQQRQAIMTHSFETYQILHGIGGFEEIALWAAYHHEEPDGSGYPFHIKGDEMPVEAHILRVADIFQAMAQDRPYRKGLSSQEVIDFLQQMADYDRVDNRIVSVVSEHLEEMMLAAHGSLWAETLLA